MQRVTVIPTTPTSFSTRMETRGCRPMSAESATSPLLRRSRRPEAREDAISQAVPTCWAIPVTPTSLPRVSKRKRRSPAREFTSDQSTLTTVTANLRSTRRRLRNTEQELQDVKEHLAATIDTLKTKEACRAPLPSAPKLGQHILMLFVGEHRDILTLHTALLPEATQAYLRANTHDGFTQLVNEDWETVDLYRFYLYSSKLHTQYDDDSDQSEEFDENEVADDAEWHRLVSMYLLGKTLHDELFTNKVIDALIGKVQESEIYPTGMATEVYEHTRHGDRLRRLIVDLHVFIGRGTGIEAPHDDANGPAAFMMDVRRGMLFAGVEVDEDEEAVEYPWSEKAGCCRAYHKHVETACCYEREDDRISVIDLTSP